MMEVVHELEINQVAIEIVFFDDNDDNDDNDNDDDDGCAVFTFVLKDELLDEARSDIQDYHH